MLVKKPACSEATQLQEDWLKKINDKEEYSDLIHELNTKKFKGVMNNV